MEKLDTLNIGQVIIATIFSAVTAYLYISGQPVPGELLVINSAIMGFFFGFGSKTNGAYEAGKKQGEKETLLNTPPPGHSN